MTIENFLEASLFIIVILSLVLSIMWYYTNKNVSRSSKHVMDVVEKLLTFTEKQLEDVLVDVTSELDFLSSTCDIIIDRIYLMGLFRYAYLINPDINNDGVSPRIRELYALGIHSPVTVQQGIISMLAIHAKLAALAHNPCTIWNIKHKVHKYINSLPTTDVELLNTLTELHLCCDLLGIPYDVYGTVSPSDFLDILRNEIEYPVEIL